MAQAAWPAQRGGVAVVALVEQLVLRAICSAAPLAEEEHAQARDRLVGYTMAILGSRMTQAPLTYLATVERMCKRIARAGCAESVGLRARELAQGLKARPSTLGPAHLAAAVQLLDALAMSERVPPVPVAETVASLAPGLVAVGSWAGGGCGGAAGIPHPHTVRPGALPAQPPVVPHARDASDFLQASSSAPHGGSARGQPWQAPGAGTSNVGTAPVCAGQRGDAAVRRAALSTVWRSSAPEPIPEAELVREALYAMQGISTQHIVFDGEEGAVVVDVAVPTATRALIARICECGTLFNRIAMFGDTPMQAEEGWSGSAAAAFLGPGNVSNGVDTRPGLGGPGRGRVLQSLCSALRRELDDYLRLLSVLDEERNAAAADVGVGGGAVGVVGDGVAAKGEAGEAVGVPHAGAVTLLKLLLWSQEPLQRLRMMSMLVERSEGHRGGALVNALSLCAMHGDGRTAAYVTGILKCMGIPVMSALRSWILEGALADPDGEFFVEAVGRTAGATDDYTTGAGGGGTPYTRPHTGGTSTPGAHSAIGSTTLGPGAQAFQTAEELWHSAYRLRTAMLPHFIPAALATLILHVGKSVRLLRDSCDERGWVAGLRSAPPPSAWGDVVSLSTWVDSVGSRVNARVRELLLSEHSLMEHLRALRQLLLLGQGDFVQHLMDSLIAELERPAAELHRHTLLGLVDAAVRSSTAAADILPDALARLDVRLRRDPNDSGWAMFTLDYHAQNSPIGTVITRNAMRQYRRLFHFLWRLKRAEFLLSTVWRQHTTALRLFRQLRGSADMRACQRLRHEMLCFVHNLQYYVMFEVLEASWRELEEKVTAAPDLNEIIAAHTAYLRSIAEDGLFLDHTPFTDPVRAITEAIFEFAHTQDRLHEALMERKATADAARQLEKKRTAAGRWAALESAAVDLETGETALHPLDADFVAHVDELRELFHEQFDLFFRMVSRHSSTRLAFLSARLDFNGYHTGRHADEADVAPHDGWAGGFSGESPVM